MNFPGFETKLNNNCNQDSCSIFKSKNCSMYHLLVKTFFRTNAFGLDDLILVWNTHFPKSKEYLSKFVCMLKTTNIHISTLSKFHSGKMRSIVSRVCWQISHNVELIIPTLCK